MQHLTICRTGFRVLIVVLLVMGATTGTGTTPIFGELARAGDGDPEDILTMSVTIPVGAYRITTKGQGDEIVVDGFGRLLVPGAPALPSKIFALAIPPGAEVVDVACDTGKEVILPGTYEVGPAPLPRVVGEEDPLLYAQDRQRYEDNFNTVYGRDDPYPQAVGEFVRPAGYRKYNLVDVRITPFAYRPLSGQLTYYPEVTVHVDYRLPGKAGAALVDHLPGTEQTAKAIVLNYDQSQSWYPRAPVTNKGLHDFVIITIDSLTSSITSLVDWENAKGRTVEVVTTSWIDANYTGYDLAEKMRNFLREKYPSDEWGIEDVLLIGHYNDVPMRRTAQDQGYGEPETDLYYAELSLPDSESWDADGDHEYGEWADPIDFYSEVNVGRIPWSDPLTVVKICGRSVNFEQADDPAYKKNMLLLGAYFWDNTDNAVLMEAKVDQPWMADWTLTRMYEKNSDYWSTYDCDYPLLHSNVMSVWPADTYAFVNWAGHGSPTSCHIYGLGAPAFIASYDSPWPDSNHPSIIFADACSNSDTDYLNLGQAMMGNGAVGFVGATKVAYGCPAWDDPYDGSGQSLDYFFTIAVTSGEYTQGQAHQLALREMYINGLWSSVKYEMFEWGALWGNPDLGMTSPARLTISFPEGPPEYLELLVPVSFTVRIVDGTESYVPGTGTLHYRYAGGTFLTSPLSPLGGELHEATLPAAGCGAMPEFYISAQGDAGTTMSNPRNAPDTVYSAAVGTFMIITDDSFETDQGWSAENLGATSGDWQRGIPVDDPGWNYDPVSDADGSGQCYLTQNEIGNTDVDDGAVRLISPVIDMSSRGWLTISYDYFLRLTDTDNGVDRLLVEIDGNDGAGPWIEIARHDTNGGLTWRHHTINQAELDAAGVVLTSTMRLGFTTNDADPQSVNESGVDAVLISAVECLELETCDDGIQNQGEERIDCGGPCPSCECTADEECPDDLFCNGVESCDAFGHCQAGGAPCTPQLCDEETDTCAPCQSDADCEDGIFCNGTETCDGFGACQPGTAVDCADGVGCTVDSCNEGTDSCDHDPNDALCDNSVYCDGVEPCDAELDCQAGVPVDCDDGIACTEDSCNEVSQSCDHVPVDALCDDSLFCSGTETCVVGLGCQDGDPPCPPEDMCRESDDQCVDCLEDADCTDPDPCNGTEICNAAGVCVSVLGADCNENGVEDFCDIDQGTSPDCNDNGIPDECDVAGGASPDDNGNGIPDECEVNPPVAPAAPHNVDKNRYVSLSPNNADIRVAFQVEMTASVRFPESAGVLGWVGEPQELSEGCFIARVVDAPVYRMWPELVIHLGDCEIVPAAGYGIRATAEGTTFSEALEVHTIVEPAPKRWADVVGSFDGATWTPPNGDVNMDDVMAAIQKFQKLASAPLLTCVDVDEEVPNAVLNMTDIMRIVQGFKGEGYPFSDPGECP